MKKWTASNIPDLKGKVIIITGATSGIGKAGAQMLAAKNAYVILAVRNTAKGHQVADDIKALYLNAKVQVIKLDLSSLQSIEDFAKSFAEQFNRLDVLINNAGVMMSPYSQTEDGFELQMGTNYLGHYALTGYLFTILKRTKASRIVVTSSMAHKSGKINFSDINWEKRKYSSVQAYSDSKIAMLHFMTAFAKIYDNDDEAPMITGAHPGWTSTDLQRHSGIGKFLNPLLGQGPNLGILPTLRASFDTDASSGDYFGPSGFLELQGLPVKVKRSKASRDSSRATRLWDLSQQLTGVYYDKPQFVDSCSEGENYLWV